MAIPNGAGLSVTEMKEAQDAFALAFLTTYASVPEVQRDKVWQDWLMTINRSAPFAMLSPSAIQTGALVNDVFHRAEDEKFAHFVLNVTSQFFMTWGEGDNKFLALVLNLTAGMNAVSGDIRLGSGKGIPLAPTVYDEILNPPDENCNLLLSNKWLVTIVMGWLSQVQISELLKTAFAPEKPPRRSSLAEPGRVV